MERYMRRIETTGWSFWGALFHWMMRRQISIEV